MEINSKVNKTNSQEKNKSTNTSSKVDFSFPKGIGSVFNAEENQNNNNTSRDGKKAKNKSTETDIFSLPTDIKFPVNINFSTENNSVFNTIEYKKTKQSHNGTPITIYENSQDSVEPAFLGSVKNSIDNLKSHSPTMEKMVNETDFMITSTKDSVDPFSNDFTDQMISRTNTVGAYHHLLDHIILYENNMNKVAKHIFGISSNAWVNEAVIHEFGHKFNHSKTSRKEERLNKKKESLMHSIREKRSKPMFTLSGIESKQVKAEQYILNNKINKTNEYSDTLKYKKAYKKDIKAIKAELEKNPKSKEIKEIMYFTQGVTFEDGINKADINNADTGRSEAFAESFNVIMEGGKSSRHEAFKKYFPNTIEATKKIVDDNT